MNWVKKYVICWKKLKGCFFGWKEFFQETQRKAINLCVPKKLKENEEARLVTVQGAVYLPTHHKSFKRIIMDPWNFKKIIKIFQSCSTFVFPHTLPFFSRATFIFWLLQKMDRHCFHVKTDKLKLCHWMAEGSVFWPRLCFCTKHISSKGFKTTYSNLSVGYPQKFRNTTIVSLA